MGMVVLQNKWNNIPAHKISQAQAKYPDKKMQLIKLTILEKFSVVFFYINKSPTFENMKSIPKFLKEQNANFILGDFNIDRNKEDGMRKINELSRLLNMKQVNKESTRNSATLDLIFKKNDVKETDFMPFVFQNLYSDHCTIGFRYCKDGVIDESFKEMKINEQDKEFLRKITIEGTESSIEGTETKQKKWKINLPTSHMENAREDPIIFKCRVDEVRSSSIKKLLTNEWIDSNLINCYLYLISTKFSHVLAIDTQLNEQLKRKRFQTIDRQFRKNNIFNYTMWLLPVNCENTHWFLLTIELNSITDRKIQINIFDSRGEHESWKRILEIEKLKSFIQWKYDQVHQTSESSLEFIVQDHYKEIPQQDNELDCGMFTMVYAKYKAAKENFTFSCDDMQRFRKLISEEIIKGELSHVLLDNDQEFQEPENCADHKVKNGSKNNIPEIDIERIYKRTKIDIGERKYKNTKMIIDDEEVKNNNDNGNKKKHVREEYPEVIIFDENNQSANQKKKKRTQANPTISSNLKIFKFENPSYTNHAVYQNLCFANSVTTVLINIQAIRNVINRQTPVNDNPILQELTDIFQKENNSITSTVNLRRVVQEECTKNNEDRPFNNNNQFDAAEFLHSLLEYMLENDHETRRTFFGRTMETLFCKNSNCNASDNIPSNENYMIRLPFVQSSLLLCLDEFFDQTVIERNCPHCKVSKYASQLTTLAEDPEILTFQIKRFDERGRKIRREISVPTRINLSSGAAYKIIGTVNHYGQREAVKIQNWNFLYLGFTPYP